MKYVGMLVPLCLAAPTSFAGVELVYDSEVFSDRTVQLLMKVEAEGQLTSFSLVDKATGQPASSFPAGVVMDAGKKELRFKVPRRNACYVLPAAQTAELQVRALERYKEQIRNTPSLSKDEGAELLKVADEHIAQLRQPKPKRTQTLAWMGREKTPFTCELYRVTEFGDESGQICLQMEGAAPKSFEVVLEPGEWWQSVQAFLALRRVPVWIEGKQDGRLLHRTVLRTIKRRAIPPSAFDVGKDCQSALTL